jgi:hypothetical protein
MPPGNDGLSPADLALVDAWVKGGAAKSAESCEASGSSTAPAACPNPDTIIKSAAPFTMGQKDDEYVCFKFDVQRSKKRHVTALSPKIDNDKILHHILLFTADAQSVGNVGTTAAPCEAFGAKDWTLVGGWAPGGKDIVFPPEAGLPEEVGTTHYIMQLHYNNTARVVGQKDNSGFGLCSTETTRANDVGLMAFGSMNFTIPPRGTRSRTCTYKLDQRFAGKKLFGANPHMHKLGRGMKIELMRGGTGAPETIIDVQGFDFEHQSSTPINVTVNAGDVVRTTCRFENPTDQPVKYGEGTGNEMCYGFTGYFPKIPDEYIDVLGTRVPKYNWTTPSNDMEIMKLARLFGAGEGPSCTDGP